MGSPKANSFTQYEMSPQETAAGHTLSLETERVIQNLIAINAEEKLALVLDPYHPLEFTQQNAYKTGVIEILKYLLDCSTSMKQPKQGDENELS